MKIINIDNPIAIKIKKQDFKKAHHLKPLLLNELSNYSLTRSQKNVIKETLNDIIMSINNSLDDSKIDYFFIYINSNFINEINERTILNFLEYDIIHKDEQNPIIENNYNYQEKSINNILRDEKLKNL